ncbi:MAG: hypothetical protein M1816_007143 [Peltula sp. TS41687]|nr:MAG: hypothetical protein M1816_007143 [Peltula sp. TS41687]
MAAHGSTFILGILILFYLSTFLFFALLRITTGISIQRIGYFSLRRIAYTPKDGIKVEVRSLGLLLHRPTFAQPTWLSLVLEELQVTVDLRVLSGQDGRAKTRCQAQDPDVNGHVEGPLDGYGRQELAQCRVRPEARRSRMWERLTDIKERIKRVHRRIHWLRMLDVVATNSTCIVLDIGNIQIGSFTMAVDTRRKLMGRTRLFHHRHQLPARDQRPAEWIFTVRGAFFKPEGKESIEIMDQCSLSIDGILHPDLNGLRDATIFLKFGRVHLPYDDLMTSIQRYRYREKIFDSGDQSPLEEEITLTEVMEELNLPGTREENIMQTVKDSKEFVGSILRGIKEVQFAVSFIRISKEIYGVQPSGVQPYVNVSMKEIAMDLHRLDPKSPAHRMYFSSADISHEALFAAIGLSIDLDDGHELPERLAHIPMTTATVKTTLPSKTFQGSEEKSLAERNANILFANVVVTSPSLDLDPKHLPLVLALVRIKTGTHRASSHKNHHLISRLLPKASVKLSVHEPVIRVALPAMEPENKHSDQYDLLISSNSSIAVDVESFHSAIGELNYSLVCNLRILSHQFYYQTALGSRYDLLMTETLDLRVQVSAKPAVCVVASGNIQTISVHMVRPEISEGVHQIVRQLQSDVQADKEPIPKAHRAVNPLRGIPIWLVDVDLRGSNFSVELAGVDKEVSSRARGVALKLESWSAEYRQRKGEPPKRELSRQRLPSRTLKPEDALRETHRSSLARKKQQSLTDGRRLAVHIHELEGFVVESVVTREPQPFLSLPRCEVAISTSSDGQGPILHMHGFFKTIFIEYNLYRYYAIGVAATMLTKVFINARNARGNNSETKPPISSENLSPRIMEDRELEHSPISAEEEFIAIDIRASLVQIKTALPSDPQLMLQIYSLDLSQHRWAPRSLKANLIRFFSHAPRIPGIWARITCIKNPRIDLRERKKKVGAELIKERSIDFSTDAIRLAVPHQLRPHRMFENIATVLKATQQLQHRFRRGNNDPLPAKEPEGPKHVPKLSFRTRSLLLELEDGPFEWKLSMIYRVGLVEQRQRLAREEAFDAKMKKLREMEYRRASARSGGRGTIPRNMTKNDLNQGSSQEEGIQPEVPPQVPERCSKFRYNRHGICGLSDSAQISVEKAWTKLQELNAQSWKKRVDWAFNFQRNAMKDIRGIFWEADELPDGVEESETILEYPKRPALLATMISDFRVLIDKPSFPLNKYPDFLHRIGKGMPYDMKYSLLIPMNLQLEMGETRMTLRDYPLPLLHIPSIRPTQSPRLPSWSIRSDFVIAEEFRDPESTRQVNVVIVPPERTTSVSQYGGLAVDVKRTVAPVKTYSDVNIEVNTGYSTRMAWTTSYQPAIQDAMMVMESFTKPSPDPSDRTGFWDKIRLICHSRVNVVWTEDGDVHFMIKGTRDPYIVTGNGAGFVMCWRNDVRWRIGQDEDPKKFMTVDSGEYILAIPDYSHQARQSMDAAARDSDTISSTTSSRRGALFKKVVMKLTGNVQWLGGLVFERNVDEGGRSFEFKPHYEVILKTPQFAKAHEGNEYDAFRGFRSHHIHLSVAVVAPRDRDWSVSNLKPSTNYNSVHLTPRFFSHFFNWWSMFSGVMSLPVRQGSLWPGLEKTSKKFGRHIATIKYSLLLSPLFIGHIYKHKDVEDYKEDLVSATGLKVKLDSFMLDLHQRREEFSTSLKDRVGRVKTSSMRINKAQLDFISADIRAVSASIAGTTAEDLKRASEETLASYQQTTSSVDMSRFTIPDNDFSWIDMDDFVELDWILPTESNPETKIMPLAYAPRFTYFRQTDHQNPLPGDSVRSSAFGDESTHFCVMSPDSDPRRIQCDLIQERLEVLNKQMEQHKRSLDEAELKVIRDSTTNEALRKRFETLKRHGNILEMQRQHLHTIHGKISSQLRDPEELSSYGADKNDEKSNQEDPKPGLPQEDVESAPLTEFANDFNNRFIVHNPQIKWNNTLRNIILRYIHQVGQRRGFVYYLSRRAVKFILDIVEEQNKSKQPIHEASPRTTANPKSPSFGKEDAGTSVEDRIQQLLQDAKKFVDADDPVESKGTQVDLADSLAESLIPQNNYHVRLIAPQIQLQSEKNTSAAVLVTAKVVQLKIIQIMDKNRLADDVSGLVQRRFSADMNSVQIFVTDKKTFASQYLPIFSGRRYGTSGNTSWPPWVPLEIMFDFNIDPFGFSRVVQKTSASLRYDKYNALRLKVNDEIDGAGKARTPQNAESQIDRVSVDFPRIGARCNSAQYYAIYLMVMDLLLYSEPLEKIRTERLERIMLASDFSDLRGAPEMVTRLQGRIRQLKEIKLEFQINAKYLDRHGWEDRLAIEQDLAGCEDELFFMMKAITTSQRRNDDRSETNALLRWYLSASEVVWHLTREKNEPLIEFQLKNAALDRTDNSDGSNHNLMHIDKIRGYNLLPDAVYPEMIAPYFDITRPFADSGDMKMLRVQWQMLEAIAGIPVMDHFEVNLFPLRIQLEREVGKKLFEYIFPDSQSYKTESSGASSDMSSPIEVTENGTRASMDTIESVDGLTSGGVYEEREINGKAPSLATRLRPTLSTSELSRQINMPTLKTRNSQAQQNQSGDHHSFRLFQSHHKSRSGGSSTPSLSIAKTKKSRENLRMTALRPLERSSSTISSFHSGTNNETSSSRRFALRRSSTKDLREAKEKDKKASDELTQMMTRASNYMTLAYVKVPSVVLCLSYQGRGERNIEDLHDFVFRMPTIEYRNKTWSNLDLALHLKRDVIRALISHIAAIIGNKFSHHRPSKQQQSRLREMVNTSTLLSSSLGGGDGAGDASTASDSSSRPESSPGEIERSVSPTRQSITSEVPSSLPRTASYASSMWSAGTGTRGSIFRGSESQSVNTAREGDARTNESQEYNFIHSASASIGRTLTHLSHLTRHTTATDTTKNPTNTNHNNNTTTNRDETDDTPSLNNQRRKSKLLLGGKKILPSL